MTTPAEKQNQAAKRGCLRLLIGAPSLAVIYLFLLSTSLFDIKPRSYPDLEIRPEGKTIPILDALESCPDWAAWKASEEMRGDLQLEISSLIHEGEQIPPDMLEQARVEVARAQNIVEDLLAIEGTFWPWWREEGGERNFAGRTQVLELIIWLTMPLPATSENPAPGTNQKPVSHMSLRFLAKNQMLSESLVGRLYWLTNESRTHGSLLSDILRAASLKDVDGLQMLLSALEETRPPGFPATAVALGGELSYIALTAHQLRQKLGDLTANHVSFGSSSRIETLHTQWLLLRMQPNRCVDYMANVAREFVAQAHLPAKHRTYPTYETRGIWLELSLAPNAGGECLFGQGIPAYTKVMDTEDLGHARHHLLRLLIGIALYRIDHGNQLPADLGALVPAYLPELPTDPYTGELPLYDTVAGKLAFRGMDFVPSAAPVSDEIERRSRERGRPPGVAGLFGADGPHDLGVDLKAFFGSAP